MYRCKCGEVFAYPAQAVEPHPEVPWGKEYFFVCPECGSDEIEEVYECQSCGEWTGESVLCEKCLEELEKKITGLLRGLSREEVVQAWNASIDMNHLLDVVYYEEDK